MKFSEFYGLGKSQFELDFVDVLLEEDLPLFIDPIAIKQGKGDFYHNAHALLADFFHELMRLVREERLSEARDLLDYLHEPKELHLGDSSGSVSGQGVGGFQSDQIYEALVSSNAAQTGLVTDIEDCALMIEGIKDDKVSDMVGNIIRYELIKYTQEQCRLHGAEMREGVPSGYFWDPHLHEWRADVVELPMPVIDGRPQKVILVPKSIVRRRPATDHQNFYRHEILEFEQKRHLDAMTALVRTLKSGEVRAPYKKAIEPLVSNKKADIISYAENQPELIPVFKDRKLREQKSTSNEQIVALQGEDVDAHDVYEGLKGKLVNVEAGGGQAATLYHDTAMAILEFVFYPYLTHPVKESRQFDGRQRIDVTFSNEANAGFFALLPKRRIACAKIPFECKNYNEDPANPEVDQLAGRLTARTSTIGFLVCRHIENKERFQERCLDKALAKQEYILGLEDADLIRLMELKVEENDEAISQFLEEKLQALFRE